MVGFNYDHFGSFTIDIGTVYKQRDRQFYRKWAPIIAHEEFTKEGYVTYKGYVKCDIGVQSAGDNVTHIERQIKQEDEDKIEIEK